MPVLWWILFAVIWIAIAFWPARVAGRKGHSFIGYFIFSLFFFPATSPPTSSTIAPKYQPGLRPLSASAECRASAKEGKWYWPIRLIRC